jgi:hypothetical protein
MSQATHIHVTRIAAMRIIFTRIGCTLLMCDMYMSDLRHIHDPVLSSLKLEGIRLLYYLSSPTPFATCATTHTITQLVSRSTLREAAVRVLTSRSDGATRNVIRNNRAVRHIHVNISEILLVAHIAMFWVVS